MKRQFLFLFIALLMLSSQSTGQNRPGAAKRLDRLSWMLGTWEMKTGDGVFSEEWQIENDTVWNGFGMLKTKKGDTVYSEKIQLLLKENARWYIPLVSNQNDGKAVSFKETSCSENEIVFENREHDFPQRISYQKISDSSMLAIVAGMQKGVNRREEFHFTKSE